MTHEADIEPGDQGLMMMMPSKSQDQSQSNMAEPSREDYALIGELLWPYRYFFGLGHFNEIVREIAREYAARKAKC